MATSPPNENNWDDAKGAEIPVSSEQSVPPPKAPTEDHQPIPLDAPKDQEENISSYQPTLSNDILANTVADNPDVAISEDQKAPSEPPSEASTPVVADQETPSEASTLADDDQETPVVADQETPSEASTLADDDQETPAAKDKMVTPSAEPLALTPEQVAISARPQASQKKRLPRGVKILLIVLAILVFLGATTAGLGYYYYTITIQKPLAQIYRPVTRTKLEKSTPTVTATSQPTYDVIKGRSWNILLLGSDNDQKYTFPDVLTQVMMIVHIDTVKNTVSMVSIPRDSWVSIPGGFGMHKIDQAFSLGEQQTGKFEDGVSLARATVEQDYGVTIDRYAWVGLDGFAKVIDTLGGIDIDVEHPIVDDDYPNDVGNASNSQDTYAYKRLDIAAGPQHLNGQETLEYVRSRHSDLVGDIGRTQRQQQVLEALKLKLNVTTVIENFTQLLKDVSGNVYSDLTESEMLAFANYGRTLLNNPIQHITLGVGSGNQDYGDLATIYDPSVGANQDVIIPNCTNIQPEINTIFQLGDTQSCNIYG